MNFFVLIFFKINNFFSLSLYFIFIFGVIMRVYFYFLFAVIITLSSCKESLGPNEIGGSNDVPFAKVGERNAASIDLGEFSPSLGYVGIDFFVIENRNGITLSKGHFETDTAFTHRIDTIIGTSTLPQQVKSALRERAIRAFQIVIDSADKNNLKFDFYIKTKVTTDGIQDFLHSDGDESKPFTIVKYSAKVGDKWDFVDKDGNRFVREVTYRSSTDDFPISFWLIKVIKVEETVTNGPLKDVFGKITYYTNHKFGTFGVEWENPLNGKRFKIFILPSNL